MSEADRPEPTPPPRAFTQGVGLVFQFVGVILFVLMMSVCCGSSLLSKDWATRTSLTAIGWHGAGGVLVYSAQQALTIGLFTAVFLGLALAGIGLGLQAEHRLAGWLGVIVTGFGIVFWSVHFIFAAELGSIVFGSLTAILAVVFGGTFGLAMGAWHEMERDPPPAGHEVLPKDYKIPYSHYHVDPPEVRLARELEARRARLAVETRELELLEERLRKRIEGERARKDSPET